MSGYAVPTVPSEGATVGTGKTQGNQGCSDCSERSDRFCAVEAGKKGSLKNLVRRWESADRECKETETFSFRDVLPSSFAHSIASPDLAPAVGTVGTVGTGLENGVFGRSDRAESRSEQSEQPGEQDVADDPELRLDLDWTNLADYGLTVPTSEFILGLRAAAWWSIPRPAEKLRRAQLPGRKGEWIHEGERLVWVDAGAADDNGQHHG